MRNFDLFETVSIHEIEAMQKRLKVLFFCMVISPYFETSSAKRLGILFFRIFQVAFLKMLMNTLCESPLKPPKKHLVQSPQQR